MNKVCHIYVWCRRIFLFISIFLLPDCLLAQSEGDVYFQSGEYGFGEIISLDSSQVEWRLGSEKEVIQTLGSEIVRITIPSDSSTIWWLPDSLLGVLRYQNQNHVNNLLKASRYAELLHVKIVLPKITFASGTAVLTDTARKSLLEWTQQLSLHPDLYWELTGFTDAVGDEKLNLVISQARVRAVKDYMASKGMISDCLHIEAMGEANPIASNATENGRSLNRRVELRLLSIKRGTIFYFDPKYVLQDPNSPNRLANDTLSNKQRSDEKEVFQKQKLVRFPKLNLKPKERQWSFQFGLVAAFPSGNLVKRLRTEFQQAERDISDAYEVKNSLLPRVFPSPSIRLSLPVSPGIMFGTAIGYRQLGYEIILRSTYRDPTYQYDEFYKGKIIVRTHTLEVPLYLSYDINEHLRMSLGIAGGFSTRKFTKKRIETETEIQINGEFDTEWSSPFEVNKIESPAFGKTVFVSGFLWLSHRLGEKMSIELSAQQYGKTYEFSSDILRSRTVGLSLIYRFGTKHE